MLLKIFPNKSISKMPSSGYPYKLIYSAYSGLKVAAIVVTLAPGKTSCAGCKVCRYS